MKKYFEMLCGLRLFSGIEEEDLKQLINGPGAYTKSYKAGDTILYMGQKTESFGIVLSGHIQIIKEDFFGNTVLLAKPGAGEVFAEAFAYSQGVGLSVTVRAEKDVLVLWLDCKKMYEAKAFWIMQKNLLKSFAEKNMFLTGRIEHLSKRTVSERVMSFLGEQAARAENTSFSIPFNRQQMADYLAVDRSALSAVLGRLKREGIIDFHKNSFVLLNYEITKN